MAFSRVPVTLRAAAPLVGYASDLAPYAVRSLSGSYAPANARTLMSSVTPSEWADTEQGLINGYSGGAKAVAGSRLYIHGGGHGDSYNNGMYIYEFAGSSLPAGFVSPLVVSAQSAVVTEADAYSDGRPTAHHSLDLLVYAHHDGNVYRFGGNRAGPAGSDSRAAWRFNPTTGAWTRFTGQDMPHDGRPLGCTIYDAASGKILVLDNADSGSIFNCATGTWGGVIAQTRATGYYSVGAYDTSRNRALVYNDVLGELSLVTPNWGANTFTMATATSSSAFLGRNAPVFFYDPVIDRFVGFGGQGSASFANVFFIHPTTFSTTSVAMTGATIETDGGALIGMYGRFCFISGSRVVGFVSKYNRAPYILKLPSVAP
jgi:hypothetical protein